VEKHDDNFPVHHVLIASLAQLDHVDDADAALKRLLETFPLSKYRNLDGMLDGLRKAGLPEK